MTDNDDEGFGRLDIERLAVGLSLHRRDSAGRGSGSCRSRGAVDGDTWAIILGNCLSNFGKEVVDIGGICARLQLI